MRHWTMNEDRFDSSQWSRARVVTGLGLVLAMLLGVAVLLREPASPVVQTDSSSQASAAQESDSSVTTSAAPSGSSSTTMSPAEVGPTTIELVDTSRPTVSGTTTIDTVRHLPTTVWRPATFGRHPLVVFAHGYQVGPMTYARFCAALAAQGYVVAAPSFPLADESRDNGLDREDIPEQALDVDFVINAMRSTDPSVDDGPVAVVGHSDGGTVALLVAERPSAMHPAVSAVVAIAPDSLKGEFTSSPPPLLIIHSINDEIAGFYNSEDAFAAFTGSRWLLALEGADHLAPIVGSTAWTPVIDRAVGLFLARELSPASSPDVTALTKDLDQLNLSRVKHAD